MIYRQAQVHLFPPVRLGYNDGSALSISVISPPPLSPSPLSPPPPLSPSPSLQLKELLSEKMEDTPVAQQCLIFAGRILKDAETLEEQGEQQDGSDRVHSTPSRNHHRGCTFTSLPHSNCCYATVLRGKMDGNLDTSASSSPH